MLEPKLTVLKFPPLARRDFPVRVWYVRAPIENMSADREGAPVPDRVSSGAV